MDTSSVLHLIHPTWLLALISGRGERESVLRERTRERLEVHWKRLAIYIGILFGCTAGRQA